MNGTAATAAVQECKGGRLWRFAEDQLSAVCWAFTRIRWHDAELFQEKGTVVISGDEPSNIGD